MQLTKALRRSRNHHGTRPATVFDGRTRSWAEVADRVARLAAGFAAVGARSGDRIAILSLNSDSYIEAYYAIAWAGCIAVPLNTRWAAAEIEHALDDSEPAILIVGREFAAQAVALARPGLTLIQTDGPGDANAPSFGSLIANNGPAPDRCGADDDLVAIFYTGGTTGRSKGVMLSHRNLIVNFLIRQSITPYSTDTRFLHTPPMFHLADAACVFGLTLLGATHVILPGFEVSSVIKAIERDKVDALVLVPTMMGMMCEALEARGLTLPSVKRVNYGASSISETVLTRAMRAFPNAEFSQGYGQTELSPVATVLTHADHLAGKLSSAGRPPPECEVRVVDVEMRDVPLGEVGEVAVRGPSVMLGYWKMPEMTAATIVDGWLRTGDAGRLDEEGYLYLVDRLKDMIVTGGENVYSAEVENALLSHPDILQCAVIGIPHPTWGEAVHAVLQLREGSTATPADLAAHCEPLIANYKRPKSFDIRNVSLPASGVGKILKSELRKSFWEGKSRHIG